MSPGSPPAKVQTRQNPPIPAATQKWTCNIVPMILIQGHHTTGPHQSVPATCRCGGHSGCTSTTIQTKTSHGSFKRSSLRWPSYVQLRHSHSRFFNNLSRSASLKPLLPFHYLIATCLSWKNPYDRRPMSPRALQDRRRRCLSKGSMACQDSSDVDTSIPPGLHSCSLENATEIAEKPVRNSDFPRPRLGAALRPLLGIGQGVVGLRLAHLAHIGAPSNIKEP